MHMTETYDVFISFKNLDRDGNTTPDAALAKQAHDFLTERGLKVFCASVSLEELGISAFKRAIDQALDSAHVLVAVGTTSENLDSEWVRYEWDSFYSDVLSGIKPEGRIFVYIRGVPLMTLPRALRQSQVIPDGPNSLQRLFNFVVNALGRGPDRRREPMPSLADAQRRLEMYATEHDNVYNIMWDSAQNRFHIELNGSSEWPSENPCDPAVLDELAKPWSVFCWYSD
jgi:hypothetical protein